MELGPGMKLLLRQGFRRGAAAISYLAAGDSGDETEDPSGGDFQSDFPVLRPTVMHVPGVPSVGKVRRRVVPPAFLFESCAGIISEPLRKSRQVFPAPRTFN